MKLGLHIHNLDNYKIKIENNKIIRIWDCGCIWAELQKNNKYDFDFTLLDKYVNFAIENNYEIIMTLGMTPFWSTNKKNKINAYGKDYIKTSPPDNMLDWDNYIRVLAIRYQDKIKYWEIWDEFDWYYFYTGTIDELIELTEIAYNILKSIDKNNIIICPSISSIPFLSWFKLIKYLNRAEGYIDEFNFHYYQVPFVPTFIYTLYIHVMKLICGFEKPLNITEFGFQKYKNINIKKLNKIIKISKLYKIDKFIYYAYDNNEDKVVENNKLNKVGEVLNNKKIFE